MHCMGCIITRNLMYIPIAIAIKSSECLHNYIQYLTNYQKINLKHEKSLMFKYGRTQSRIPSWLVCGSRAWRMPRQHVALCIKKR